MPKPAESLDAVGHDIKSTGKDRSNGAVPGSNVQGSGLVSEII